MEPFRKFLERTILGTWTCTRIELVLASVKGQTSVVDSVTIEDAALFSEEDKLADLLNRLANTAQADADGWGGCCRYFLRAAYSEQEAPPTRSPVVRVHARDDDGADAAEGGEPANATGLVAQAHRHTEAVTRQLVMQSEAFTKHSLETISRLTEANTRLEAARFESMQVVEDLASERHKRDIELRRENEREKNKARMLDAFMPLLPAVGGKLLMGKNAPTAIKNDPAMLTLVELTKSLNADDLAGLQKVLGNERFIALLEAISRVAPSDESEPESEPTDGGEDDNGTTINPWH